MLVIEEHIPNAEVLCLSGRFDQHNAVALETAMQRAEESGTRHIIFNLEKVSSIDNYGIGTLLLTYYRLKGKGICFSLVSPKSDLKNLLESVDLPKLIPMFDFTEEVICQLEIPLQEIGAPESSKPPSTTVTPDDPVPTWIHRPASEASA